MFRVADSYYGVLLAKKEVEVAEQAMKTAQAILDRSKNRVESGVVVESDALSAQVRVAARKQELIRAQNNLSMARAQLSTAMGLSTQNDFEPSDALAEKTLPATSLEELRSKPIEIAAGFETNSLGRSGAAAERVDREIVLRTARECVCELGGGQSDAVRGRRRKQLDGGNRSAVRSV